MREGSAEDAGFERLATDVHEMICTPHPPRILAPTGGGAASESGSLRLPRGVRRDEESR